MAMLANPSTKLKMLANKTPQKTIGNYKLVHKLGRGAFGQVHLAKHTLLGGHVAVKVIDTSLLGQHEKVFIHREALILSKLNHPNIVKLIEIHTTEKFYCLVLQYLPGSRTLYQLLRERGPLSENFVRFLSRQIVSALLYLDTKNVLHRDIKLDNILIDGSYSRCLLIDFGLSDLWHPNPPTFYGTPEYAAPESFGQEPMLDIWSFGIVLFGMLTGNLPFNTERKKRSRYERLIKKVVGGLTEVHIKKMKSLSPDCRLLITQCLELNPMRRINIEDIAIHTWFIKDFGAQPVKYVEEKSISPHVQRIIVNELITLLQDKGENTVLTVQNHIESNPYGRIGGVFNLMMLKIQDDQLLADKVAGTKTEDDQKNAKQMRILATKNKIGQNEDKIFHPLITSTKDSLKPMPEKTSNSCVIL